MNDVQRIVAIRLREAGNPNHGEHGHFSHGGDDPLAKALFKMGETQYPPNEIEPLSEKSCPRCKDSTLEQYHEWVSPSEKSVGATIIPGNEDDQGFKPSELENMPGSYMWRDEGSRGGTVPGYQAMIPGYKDWDTSSVPKDRHYTGYVGHGCAECGYTELPEDHYSRE